METSTKITLLTIFLPIIGAGIGYLIKHWIEKNKELLSEVHKERRQFYLEYTSLVVDLLDQSKNDNINDETIHKFYNFYKKYILYASPGVIVAYGNFMQYLYNGNQGVQIESKILIQLLSKIIFEMRRDLGLSNKKLGTGGDQILRALFHDLKKLWNNILITLGNLLSDLNQIT